MIDAEKMGFQEIEKKNETGTLKFGNSAFSINTNAEVKIGDKVELKCKDTTLIVKVTQLDKQGLIDGTILEIKTTKHHDLFEKNALIKFKKKHILSNEISTKLG